MATDWGTATDAEVALLYRSVRMAVQRLGITMARFYALASDEPPPGPEYERNFRRGKIARRRAVHFFEWLENECPDLAEVLEKEIERSTAGIRRDEPWEQLVAQRDEIDPIEIAIVHNAALNRQPSDRNVKVTREAIDWIRVDQTISMHSHFAIQIRMPFEGDVHGFQWTRGVWWGLGFSRPEIYTSRRGIEAWFPAHPNRINKPGNKPDFFVEREHPGINRLAFVIVKSPLPRGVVPRGNRAIDMTALNKLAAELTRRDQVEWRVMNRTVQFFSLQKNDR